MEHQYKNFGFDNTVQPTEAELSKRFVHKVVDLVVFFIISKLFIEMANYIFNINIFEQPVVFIIILVAVYAFNYGWMEIRFQKTVGKFLTKTKVVTLSGEKPGSGVIWERTLCRFIPFDWLSFLFAKSGFHDSVSKTKVINEE